MRPELDATAATLVALMCLVAAVVEARRVRAGRAGSRVWFVVALTGAAVCTVWAVQDLLGR